ncbi:MAG: NAD(P)H-hydrate dehydratase [Deltaproteobacteria bacterium]|jgi:NAD(P)H-hydrate epimerase|nr:NAD(P)H-hydrate dehydratase [Deltaproteobacteria bacterium]
MKLVTAGQMQGLDYSAIHNYKVPSLELMENAGCRTVDIMLDRYGDPLGRTVVIFVGPGNNGGDGLVIARLLAARLARPVIFLLVPSQKLKGDSAHNYARLSEFPVRTIEVHDETDLQEAASLLASDCWAAVDAIFGTGLTREVSGIFAAAIEIINKAACPVIAVDMPSGLHSDNGEPLGTSVRSDITVTFGQAKIGQVIHPGREYTGYLEVVDIGIPEEVVEEADIRLELLTSKVGKWLPPRKAAAHKGTFGHLLIIAGALGKTGAALLCGSGGLRAGTGLVTLCVPYEINSIIESGLWEAMTVPLQSAARGILSIEDYTVIKDALQGKQALVVGPGIGTAQETAELIEKLYHEIEIPMLIDADGLNILAENKTLLKKTLGERILTPHPGEMSRLTGLKTSTILQNRFDIVCEFATEHNVHVVLKGTDTLVCDPKGHIAVNPTGNAGMATGGMGDVLAGLIGGFLAQGLSPWQASCLGVYAHGLAGDRLAEETTCGFLASELADQLPFVLEDLRI